MSIWLESVGLGNCAHLFEASKIDMEVLSELTPADLRELGLPLGPRKKLGKAMAELAETRSAQQSARSALRAVAEDRGSWQHIKRSAKSGCASFFARLAQSVISARRYRPGEVHGDS